MAGRTEDSGPIAPFNRLRGGIGSGSVGMESSLAGVELSPLLVNILWRLLARDSSSLLKNLLSCVWFQCDTMEMSLVQDGALALLN